MKILFSTTARLGHLRSLLPFAVASVAAGHQVAVAGPRSLGQRISSTGFEFLPFDEIGADELGAIRRTATERSSGDAMTAPRLMTAHSARAALPGMRASAAAYRPDLVVRDVAELASSVVARSLAIPEVPVLTTLHGWMHELVRTSAPVLEQLSDHVPAAGGSTTTISLLPQSFDPVDDVPVHRFRRPSPPARTRPTRPLVYVSYGSVTSSTDDGEELLRSTAAALADLPVSIVVSVDRSYVSSWGAYGTNIYPRDSPNEEKVLARADVVVCHGGPGTTLSSLRAGVPLLVVPQTCDQFAIAEAAESTGVGLRVGHEGQGRPTPSDLRSAVVRLLAESSFGSKARAIADEIAGQLQAPAAVALFEQLRV